MLVHVGRGDAEGQQPVRLEGDAHLAGDAAQALDAADALHPLETPGDDVVHEPRQVLRRHGRAEAP